MLKKAPCSGQKSSLFRGKPENNENARNALDSLIFLSAFSCFGPKSERIPVFSPLTGFDRFVRFVHSPFLDRERLVCRIRRRHPVSSCFAEHDHLTRPLCSSPITGPSTLLRVDPSQSPASVLSPRGFRRLCFSLAIRGWFLQFRAKAYVRLTPPLRRSPSAQSSGPRWTCPRRDTRPWF